MRPAVRGPHIMDHSKGDGIPEIVSLSVYGKIGKLEVQ